MSSQWRIPTSNLTVSGKFNLNDSERLRLTRENFSGKSSMSSWLKREEIPIEFGNEPWKRIDCLRVLIINAVGNKAYAHFRRMHGEQTLALFNLAAHVGQIEHKVRASFRKQLRGIGER